MSVSIHFLAVLWAVFIAGSSCSTLPWLAENRAALFIFGDSLFDAGNNNFINTTKRFQANVYPYGESFFKYPTGRFSDGRIIPDFIAEFAGLPLIQPYLHPGKYEFSGGANFASAGSGALVEANAGLVIDLKSQLGMFEKMEKQLKENFGDEIAKKTISRAVYLISIGSNDYYYSYARNSTVLPSPLREEFVSMVIGNITTVIKGIHSKGGRKFGFLNLGPLGCLPQSRALSGKAGMCAEELNEVFRLHNRALKKALPKLSTELDGFKYSLFNFFDALSENIDNPSKYGFKEVKEACCGSGPYRGRPSCGGRNGETDYELCANPAEYLFFDASHPSEKANQDYAKLIWGGSPDVTGPYNLEALFTLH